VKLSDGSIRNSYTIRILNKLYESRTYSLGIEGLPGAQLSILGLNGDAASQIEVAPDDLRTLKIFITLPPQAVKALEDSRAPFSFIVRDTADGAETSSETAFRGPDQ
jgi:polyferredoxin